MATFTFADESELNSRLITKDTNSNSFTTSTTFGVTGLKVTTLTSKSPSGVVGRIDWRNRTFEVEGVTKTLDQVRIGPGSVFTR